MYWEYVPPKEISVSMYHTALRVCVVLLITVLAVQPTIHTAAQFQSCVELAQNLGPIDAYFYQEQLSHCINNQLALDDAATVIHQFTLALLNSGDNLDNLETALKNLQYLETNPETSLPYFLVGDINGDGQKDVAFRLVIPTFDTLTNYRSYLGLGYVSEKTDQLVKYSRFYSTSMPAVAILPSEGMYAMLDLNNDGLDEVLIESVSVGEQTQWIGIDIWGWRENQSLKFVKLSDDGYTYAIPNPIISIDDPDNDGLFVIKLTAIGESSVGAGIYRRKELVSQYDPDTKRWHWLNHTLPSNYNIHILADAENAMAVRDFPTAIGLYLQLLTDKTLKPLAPPTQLQAFARYRLMQIYIFQSQDANALVMLNDLHDHSQAVGSVENLIYVMAVLYRDQVIANGVHAACQAVERFVDDNRTAILFNFGSENRSYTAQGMCFPDKQGD
jgi:hypothetical protein